MPVIPATQEDHCLKSAWAIRSWDPILKIRKTQKKGWWNGSRCRPWVQAPVLKKKKKKRWLGHESSVLINGSKFFFYYRCVCYHEWFCYESEFGPLFLALALSCPSTFSCGMTQYKGARCWLCAFELPNLQNCEKEISVLYKLSCLRHSVIAAQRN
jgi:hypothetical protein